MDKNQFKEYIKNAGMTLKRYSAFTGISLSACIKYSCGQRKVPKYIDKLVTELDKNHFKKNE
jgi:hypothetical protein